MKLIKDADMTGGSYVPASSNRVVRCYESHPTIEIGGGEVLGASCLYPQEGHDIYIGFDRGMQRLGLEYPWEEKSESRIEFLFKISDMCAPKSPKDFKLMIEWITQQLELGKKVHMGCIGGHGRTGMVMSALVRTICDIEDSTTWVRENYCKKAVESDSQVNFLHKHFGVTKTKATKGSFSSGKSYLSSKVTSKKSTSQDSEEIPCLDSPFSIW